MQYVRAIYMLKSTCVLAGREYKGMRTEFSLNLVGKSKCDTQFYCRNYFFNFIFHSSSFCTV